MTKRTDKTRASTDHSELLNGKRPDIDARLMHDIVQADSDLEISVTTVVPSDTKETFTNAGLPKH